RRRQLALRSGAVDDPRGPQLPLAAVLVDVPEQVHLGLDPGQVLDQLLAAHAAPVVAAVPVALRRAVRHEPGDAPGNELPLRIERRAAVEVERPVEEARLPGAAPDAQA